MKALQARRNQRAQRPKLTPEQKQRLVEVLRSGAEEQIAVGERWTGKREAALIRREFGIPYHPEYIPRLLRPLWRLMSQVKSQESARHGRPPTKTPSSASAVS